MAVEKEMYEITYKLGGGGMRRTAQVSKKKTAGKPSKSEAKRLVREKSVYGAMSPDLDVEVLAVEKTGEYTKRTSRDRGGTLY